MSRRRAGRSDGPAHRTSGAGVVSERVDRRRALQVFGGVLGLAAVGSTGCGVIERFRSEEIEPTTMEYTSGDRSFGIDVYSPRRIVGDSPAVLLFHGGGWNSGERSDMSSVCQHLAQHGFLAATADYRLDETLLACAQDALAAYEFMLAAADDLGIDADLFSVGGGSAGGHLAACLAVCPVVAPSAPPASAVLFNPALDMVAIAATGGVDPGQFGTQITTLSPVHQDLAEAPPTIIFHGTADQVIPIVGSRRYRDAAEAAGAICELQEFEGRHHEFYRPRDDGSDQIFDPNAFYDPDDFETVVEATEAFLDER